MNPRLPMRDDLRGAAPYGAPQLDVPIRLNTNENPYPPPPEVVADLRDALATAAAGLNRYPDREALGLRAALGAYAGHTTEGTWAANGSNEVIQQVLQAFGGPGRTALGFVPSYSMHHLISKGTGTTWAEARRDPDDFTLSVERAVAAVERHRPDVTFLCSPNNPTATALPHEVVVAVHDATDGMVVVDEAYAEFSHQPSAITLLHGRPRLIVTRTMSKAFALAGARVGYLAADPDVVDVLRLVRLPYHLSSLTQTTALVALHHAAALLANVDRIKHERDRLVRELPKTVPSDANFVLFGAPDGTWHALLDRGVLVRDVGLHGWLRVTAGRPEENDAFLAALREVTA